MIKKKAPLLIHIPLCQTECVCVSAFLRLRIHSVICHVRFRFRFLPLMAI